MSAEPQPTHINALDDDSLLLIFTINGSDMFVHVDEKDLPYTKPALHTTRATSLVCQRWRNLMLATPSLWARLIDIYHISYPGHYEWRKELMRRTGTAPLWIKFASFRYPQPADFSKDIFTFFDKLMHENWHRVQKLAISGILIPIVQGNSTWEPLLRPAPVLETFDVQWQKHPTQNTDMEPLATLFSGFAPMLRTFRCFSYSINENASWLCNLRTMDFDSAYGVRLLLGVLSSTRYLEELVIRDTKLDGMSTPLPIASLPHLRSLFYYGPPQQGAMILDHIEIPPQCLLNIRPFDFSSAIPSTATEEQCLSIITAFVRSIQHYLRFRRPNRISLRYHLEDCIIVDVISSFPVYAGDQAPFTVSIPMRELYDPRLPSTNLTSIILPELSCITELQFFTNHSLNPTLRSFFGCFTSVKTIHVAAKCTLKNLTQLQYNIDATDDGFIILPALETISLNDWWLDNAHFTADDETIEFIIWRIKAGHPITTLRFRNQVYINVAQDLEALSKSEGFVEGYPYVQRSLQRRGRPV